jgi:hypothetical protein
MEHGIDGALAIAFTFTVHLACSPAQWRRWMDSMNQRCVRRGWAAVWRIELQKRKVPHLHLVFHLPGARSADDSEVAAGIAAVRQAWLDVSGQAKDTAACEHAVHWKAISGTGWAVYQSLHDGKNKTAQLGWQGRQWGVWNRSAFSLLECQWATLTARQAVKFDRQLNRYSKSRGGKNRLPTSGNFHRICNGAVVARLAAWAHSQ